jgi:hypothetical protein
MLLWACCDSFSGEEESDGWDDFVCFDTFRGRDLQQANADHPLFAYQVEINSGEWGGAALLF